MRARSSAYGRLRPDGLACVDQVRGDHASGRVVGDLSSTGADVSRVLDVRLHHLAMAITPGALNQVSQTPEDDHARCPDGADPF